jgi:hypothetical protein
VVNHIRLCFLAYSMSARLGREWGIGGDHREVTLKKHGLTRLFNAPPDWAG